MAFEILQTCKWCDNMFERANCSQILNGSWAKQFYLSETISMCISYYKTFQKLIF